MRKMETGEKGGGSKNERREKEEKETLHGPRTERERLRE